MERLTTPPEVKQILLKTLAVPSALVIVVIVFSAILFTYFKTNQRLMDHNVQITNQIDLLELAAMNARDNFDAYWFSGKEIYLESARENSAQFDRFYESLHQMVARNPVQTQMLQEAKGAFHEWREFAESPLTGSASSYVEKSREFGARVIDRSEALLYSARDERNLRGHDVVEIASKSLVAIAILTLTAGFVFAYYRRRAISAVADIYEQALKSEKLALDKAHSALATRDEFLSVASHELKTPLTSLKLQLQLTERALKFRADPSPMVVHLKQSVTTALRQTNSLTDLVDQLLDIAKIQSGRFALSLGQTDISSMVKDIATRYSNQMRAAKTPLKLELQENLCGHWDRFRLEQVVVNLLSNAIKYAPHKPIHIATRGRPGYARLEIRDFGPGISVEQRQKIFERFERGNSSRSVAGLGLGLFITKNIITSHGGSIWVDDKVDNGCRFIVDLPLKTAALPFDGLESFVETPSNRGQTHVV